MIIALFCPLAIWAQAYSLEWQRAYDWDSEMSTSDEAYDIQPTTDHGYIVAGRAGLDPLWDAKARVTRLNATGTVVWEHIYGDSTATCYITSIRQTADGGYIALGSVTGFAGFAQDCHGSYDLLVMKLDASGAVQWHRSFGGSDNESPGAIRQTPDGGYIVAGCTASNDGDVPDHHHFDANNPWSDLWLVRLDASGHILWQNTYGGSSEENAAQVEVLQDGSYIVCGNTSSNDGDVSGNHSISTDGWVAKISSTGALLWQQCFGGPGEERLFDIIPTADNGFIAAGYNSADGGHVSGFHGGYYDGWVVKMNSTGMLEWQKTIGGSGRDMAGSVKQLQDGSYVVAGEGNSPDGDVVASLGQRDVWTCYLSPAGNITSHQVFGGAGNDGYLSGWSAMQLGVSIMNTADHGLVLAASTTSATIPGCSGDGGDFYVIKLKGACDTSFTIIDSVLCADPPFLITLTSTITGADSYRWVNSVPGPTITVVAPGTYFCTVLTGCNFHVDTFHILLPSDLPDSSLPASAAACDGSDFRIGYPHDIPGISYLWSNGGQHAFTYPLSAGSYRLTMSNGCVSREELVDVTLFDCAQCLFIPNAFSPNGDGLNDVFEVKKMCRISGFHMQVYNRWGQVVFQAYDVDGKWNGYYNGKPADGGTYFYYISFTGDDKIQYRKGEINLIR